MLRAAVGLARAHLQLSLYQPLMLFVPCCRRAAKMAGLAGVSAGVRRAAAGVRGAGFHGAEASRHSCGLEPAALPHLCHLQLRA